MSKIAVYFVNNHAVEFDRDKVCFKGSGETFFTLSETYQEEDLYSSLVTDGKALVNWENVAFVKEAKEKNPLEEE